MGCDIHMLAEVRRREKEDERWNEEVWEVIDEPIFKNPYYKKDGEHAWEQEEFTFEPYGDRNYTLFGFLADVRNGYGVAGSDMGNAVEPIDMPRGNPTYASSEWKALVYDWGEGLHSSSWFTLDELLHADWEQPVTRRMYVSPEDYEQFKKDGVVPNSGWGGSSGVDVTGEKFEKMTDKEKEGVHGVQIEWTRPMKTFAESFYDGTIKDMERYARKNKIDTNDIRIVFGFDN